MAVISIEDLAPFADIPTERAQAMIDDAVAVALRVAPCLSDPAFPYLGAAKAILRRAILRWNETGVSGSTTSETAGPFTHVMTTRPSSGLLWPSEITDLQKLCRDASSSGRAFSVMPKISPGRGVHAEVCSTVWGGTCSCGSDINGSDGPLWELP
ncbi:hypothetical protein [Acidipropionibacterium timonense]|uniref:hypothetical protein n=1 Tax=Acidipropionibacterium timonense TaxID=2161818 RepID=UPI00102F4D8A|nr:hypothetical protein [Acidipropionibacterium timonense]